MLVCNYLIVSVFGFLLQYIKTGSKYKACLVGLAFASTLSVVGWLADAHIGRYKVIYCSVLIMWIAMVLAAVSSVTAHLVDSYYHISIKVQVVLLVVVAGGFGGFLANIIQFGIDQLYDALTTEIKSFIIWYVWTLVSGGLIVDFPFSCLSEHYIIIRLLVVCINLTLSLILLFCCNHWLTKEPVIQNPFKLVYKVIKYAIKNKIPQNRSAFTYCEDDLPSRIDFGKIKYGGQFTTEQVEDVKTFLRLLPAATVGGILISVVVLTDYLRDKLCEQFTGFSESDLEHITSSKTVLAMKQALLIPYTSVQQC